MPYGMVQAHRLAMPRIQARELLLAVNVAAIAAGTMDKDARREAVHRWNEQAELTQPLAKPKNKAALKAAITTSGLGYREI